MYNEHFKELVFKAMWQRVALMTVIMVMGVFTASVSVLPSLVLFAMSLYFGVQAWSLANLHERISDELRSQALREYRKMTGVNDDD